MLCLLDDLVDGKAMVIEGSLNIDDCGVIVVKKGKKINAFLNLCPHAGLPLNLNDANVLASDNFHLICKNHAALFDPCSGLCVSGPCFGKSLKKLDLKNNNGKIYITKAKGN